MSIPSPKDEEVVIGIDYGLRRIGIAVGNSFFKSAQGLGVVEAFDGRPNEHQIEEYVDSWQPTKFVVGMPVTADMNEILLHRKIKNFSRWLNNKFEIPVEFVNESFSSIEADYRMASADTTIKRKDKKNMRNQLAAEIILETYFSSDCE